MSRSNVPGPIVFASVLLLAAAACGGPEGSASIAEKRQAVRTRALAVSYAPAAPTCGAMPGPAVLASAPLASAIEHVSGYQVCGPFSASRGTSTFACKLPAGAAGPFRLLVHNGNADGTARASSAAISVNGVTVLGAQSFDRQVSAATARVSLLADNTIGVQIQDAAGSVQLEVVDEGQTCSIQRPVDVLSSGFQTTLSSPNAFPVPEFQLFNGGLDGSSPTNKGQVSFDGALLASRQDIREKVTAILSPLTVAAPNALSARAGEKGLFNVQVVDRDATPPHFSVQSPADGSFTNKPQLTVTGIIDDPSATVLVNGTAAGSTGGTFSGAVPLAACWNTVQVIATDPCGNRSAASVRVGLDTVPPVLAILSPPSGLITKQPAQQVTLRYSDDFSGVDLSSVRLSLDGADVTGSLSVGADAATGALTLAEGRHTLHAQVSDRASNVTAQDSTFIVDLTPPVLTIVAPADGSTVKQSSVAVTVTYSDALSGVDAPAFTALLDGQDVTKSFAPGPVSAAATLKLAAGPHQLDVEVADLAANVAHAKAAFTVSTGSALPPDPATVAPRMDPTVATDNASATSFLYSGANPIQTGVAPGTIEARRVAVIRGQVKGRDGNALPGVQVTVLGHPELGSTLTRVDGMFDMAVNGGGPLTMSYQKDGYLPVQRQAQAPWRDYVWADDVVLVPFDTNVTAITLGSSVMQVARGTPVTDADGMRQATALFPAGTNASLVMPDEDLELIRFRGACAASWAKPQQGASFRN